MVGGKVEMRVDWMVLKMADLKAVGRAEKKAGN